ncbi:hypothetical protein IMG5_203800 [Ichthyophthirius multifiliis]|uniref:Transmembrane protein n=1 Tax=Ichthyophthirius multifiliis TaxID=5932 RepID=G0R6C4_ICHMU|nr:hypothetical protein IMG5_203800 [Ichthyophthirius multifiliis]EGR26981.1 hypothetical protein IMG5_203800 [Ichthyophthirius multifiliis]|eukprot:XP_004023865.1 hypothetical protein IMG5_203800 [Ichthyophthirius multifiliis]
MLKYLIICQNISNMKIRIKSLRFQSLIIKHGLIFFISLVKFVPVFFPSQKLRKFLFLELQLQQFNLSMQKEKIIKIEIMQLNRLNKEDLTLILEKIFLLQQYFLKGQLLMENIYFLLKREHSILYYQYKLRVFNILKGILIALWIFWVWVKIVQLHFLNSKII